MKKYTQRATSRCSSSSRHSSFLGCKKCIDGYVLEGLGTAQHSLRRMVNRSYTTSWQRLIFLRQGTTAAGSMRALKWITRSCTQDCLLMAQATCTGEVLSALTRIKANTATQGQHRKANQSQQNHLYSRRTLTSAHRRHYSPKALYHSNDNRIHPGNNHLSIDTRH